MRNREVREELLRDLADMKKRLGAAVAVVVTGDIAFSGSADEYGIARAWLDDISERFGTDNCLVLTVPGNHDVQWSAITTAAGIVRRQLRTVPVPQITALLDSLLADGDLLMTPLENYNEFALRYRCEIPASGLPWEASLPLRGGYHLALRGLTSVFNSDWEDTEHSLIVGKTQTILRRDPGAVHVLLAHHGPEDCRDKIEIRDRSRGKAALLLCGHKHDQRINVINGCVELVAGAVHPEEEPGWYPTYNWLRVDVVEGSDGPDQLTVEIFQRVLRPEWNEFRSGHGGSESELFVLPLGTKPPEIRGAVTDSPIENLPAIDDHIAEGLQQTEDTAEQRPPLLDGEGNVDVERRVTRDLLDLLVPDQERLLLACGLLTQEERSLSHIEMIRTALGRLTDVSRTQLADLLQAEHAKRQEKE
jgi:hypothetical protein